MQEQTLSSTGYKVAIPTGPRASSFQPATRNALRSIRYRIGQTTTPSDSGPLAVFDNIEHARQFRKHWCPSAALLEVSYIQSGESTLWKKNPPEFVRNSYGRGYHAVSTGTTELHISECPSGTVLAEAVTPTRIVTD